MQQKIPYGRQYVTEDDIAAVVKTLKSDCLSQGPQVAEFEASVSQFCQVPYAVAVANGTAALHLACLALGCGEGDKVIVSPLTFAASANAIRYVGGEVIFADVDADTGLLCPKSVEKLLTQDSSIRGIVTVDYAGHPSYLKELGDLARAYGLWILEDACHAIGAVCREGYLVGSSPYVDAAVFSFHPVKHIACGEGGMVVTKREDIFKSCQKLRTHGITKNQNEFVSGSRDGWYQEMQSLGYNFRLSDILAALGNSQMSRLSDNLARRRELARKYDQAFKESCVRAQKTENGVEHAYHLYVIRVKNRAELYTHLNQQHILAQVHYVPVYWHPYYQQLGYKRGLCPHAESFYAQCLSLPLFPQLSDSDQAYVIEKVLEVAE